MRLDEEELVGCQAAGELRPNDPDRLVRRAAWVQTDGALSRLAQL